MKTYSSSRLLSLFIPLIFSLLLGTCGSSEIISFPDGDYAAAVKGITLSFPSDLTIQLGQEKTITAEIFPDNAAFQEIVWESSDTNVIDISSLAGKSIILTSVSNGTAVITASAGGKSKSIRVTVNADRVTGISFNTDHLTLLTNTAVDLSAVITPLSATNQRLLWSNANTNVAEMTVSNHTVTVRGLIPGRAVITAAAADGGWQAVVTVSVMDFWVTNITLSKTNLTLEYRNEGDTTNLTASILPADAPIKNIRWESSDPGIAAVTNGKVYPVRSGRVTVTAVSGENSHVRASADVTVIADWLHRITLSPASIGLEQTSNAVVTASFSPVSALNTNLTWLSLSGRVATVSDNGDGSALVTGISGGTTVIMARAGNKDNSVTVSVTPDPVNNLRQNLTCSKADTAEMVWAASPGADNYKVYRVENGVTNRITATASPVFTADGLAANTYYTYEVKACAGDQCSAPSSLRILTGSSGNDLAAIIASGKIPADLNNYGKSYQDVFGGYAADAGIVFRYVAPNGSGKMDGSSWANAAANLRTVLNGIGDAAADKVYAVLIKPGVYQAGGEMAMKNYVTISGGVSGCGTIPSNIEGVNNSTILSGNNSYRVFNNNGLNSTARLYGVTIADGNARVGNGGGMYNDNSSPTLTGVVFSGNTADQNGGGMANRSSSPILTKVLFSGNTADFTGGGMYNRNSSPSLTGVVFSGNTANNLGGGMFNEHSRSLLNEVVFSGNTANEGGGMANWDNSSPVLTGVVFSGNTANNRGGGMYNSYSSPFLSGVVFSGNTADFTGGGMLNLSSSPILTGVVFSGNTANNRGGGMYNSYSSPFLSGVVFSGNTANYYGGGIFNDNNGEEGPIIVNSIFWGNRVGSTANQIHFNNNSYGQENLSLYHTIVEGGMPSGYISGTTTNSFNGGGFLSTGQDNIVVNFSGILSADPGLGPLTDNGGGVDTMAIPTTSPAVNKGIFVKRSAAATGRDAANNPTYTFYYSIDKTSWYSSPALTGATVNLPGDAIHLTATDMTGYPVTGRPDIGVYEAR